ncbi:hypothetical protein OROMI_022441 [Orobanche minor]
MPIWSNIRDLKPRNFGWNMRLRLVRAYDVLDFAGKDIKTIECIFHDETGDRIHAQIKKTWVPKHKHILEEGKLYRMSKFLVALNDMPYPTTDAPFMINIFGSTLIYEDPKEDFPNLRFVLKSFADFETNTNIVIGKLYDIIGLVVNFSEPKEFMNKNGRQSKFSDIILEDTESRRLCHTLWGTQVDQMQSYIEENGREMVICLIQLCKTKMFDGKYTTADQWRVTQMFINEDWEIFSNFKTRLAEVNKTNIECIVSASTGGPMDIAEECHLFRTIEEIFEDKGNKRWGSYWICATIKSIGKYGRKNKWYFTECDTCKKGVHDLDPGYYCLECDKEVCATSKRYRLFMKVSDCTASAEVIMWDKQCAEVIGRTVSELLEEMIDKDDDLDDIPEQIKHLLLNRKMLFKIQIKPEENYNYTESFGVRNLVTDRSKVSEYAGFFSKNKQESDIYTIGESEVKSNSHGNEIASDEEVSTPKKDKGKEKADEGMQFKNIKRKLYDEMSATRPRRKTNGIVIKEEKMESR